MDWIQECAGFDLMPDLGLQMEVALGDRQRPGGVGGLTRLGDTMRLRGLVLILVLVLALFSLFGVAMAQVPPHPPGTICFTRFFWCWAQPPGPPGSSCGCPGPQGWVPVE